MTIATDLGFKIGELYRVKGSKAWTNGMIVEFVEDDGSYCPWFKYSAGTCDDPNEMHGTMAIDVKRLVPLAPIKTSINKPLLVLYIQQQYPDDKVLKALVSAL